ncbi:MAG: ABC transporter transmembrane domain-containing protein, partial [Gammaproteobacteria bacterium]
MTPQSEQPTSTRPALGSFGTLRRFLPYLWPENEWGLRARVVLALVSLVAAKVAVVYLPLVYRDAIDALDMGQRSAALVLPVGLILAYGAARVLSLAFGELRDALFAKVGQRAVRTIALQVFRHLHVLSLEFHLSRQTGGLSRSIERGTKAIEILLRFSLFSIVPTILELTLVFVILWKALDVWVALATVVTVAVYITYTMLVTEWRIKFRRVMNEEDNRANTRAIDSLLNYETVKYFGNEAHEARRYDAAMRGYEKASIQSQTSLALLNVGQAVIISLGLTAVMLMTASGIVSGALTI